MAPCSSLASRRLRSFIESLTELEHVVSRLLPVAPCVIISTSIITKPYDVSVPRNSSAQCADAALAAQPIPQTQPYPPTAYVRSACNPPVAPAVKRTRSQHAAGDSSNESDRHFDRFRGVTSQLWHNS